MYTLEQLRELDEKYTIEYVNCMEKPFGVVLNSYNSDYRNLYLLFLKLAESYKIKILVEQDWDNMYMLDKIMLILKQILNFDLHRVSINNIHDFIDEQIRRNNPVIIPGNLRELFYSKFYGRSNWNHYFIIYGIDKENKLYNILDSTQVNKNDETNYYKFVLPFDIVEKMYVSYQENLKKEGVYYFDSEKIDISVDHLKMLILCFKMYLYGKAENPYLEFDILENIMRSGQIDSNVLGEIKSIANDKYVFYNELLFALERYLDSETMDKVRTGVYQYNQSLTLLVNRLIYYICKNDKDGINIEKSNMLEQESIVCSLLSQVFEQLKHINYSLKSDILNQFENNEDNIITIRDYKYWFNFNTGKLYNHWFADEAPKIVLLNNEAEFKFYVKIRLIDFDVASQFLAGIFLRTESGETYNWGINCGCMLLLEKTGIDPNLFVVSNCSENVVLGIQYKNNQCKFMYKFEDQGKLLTQIEKVISLSTRIKTYGISCKTWGEYNRLEFSADYSMNTPFFHE